MGDYTNDDLNEAQIQSLSEIIGAIESYISKQEGYYGDPNMYTHGAFESEKSQELIGARDQLEDLGVRYDSFIGPSSFGGAKR